jgi:hypothetical protein
MHISGVYRNNRYRVENREPLSKLKTNKIMKNLLNKTPVFLNDWSSKEGLETDFSTSLADVNVLFASYSSPIKSAKIKWL